ncbi:MAG: hypothetical protein FGM27_09730 [Candidatus Omnitrophica bacterium]|nr:hypothetical protein [Candidatus Omnitrophota bacterium]
MKNDYKRTMRQLSKARRRIGVEKTLGQGLQDLQKVINKHFESGAADWHPRDVFTVMGQGADILDPGFLKALKAWESEGYIRIVDTPVCLFRVLKPFERESARRTKP